MNDSWSELRHLYERIRWARFHAGFERAKDAADSLGIKPGTYRTYERRLDDNGREPPLTEIQRIARKFKVSWIWLAAGEGSPDQQNPANEKLSTLTRRAADLPDEKRDDALNAAIGVLESYIPKRA